MDTPPPREPTGASGTLRLVVVPHTHWDREWYQPFQDFRHRLVRLVDRLLDLLDRDPAFAHFHLDGQTIVIEDYLEVRPEQHGRLRRLIKAGRVAIGPWYVLPDELLVSGESIVRNLLLGHRVAAEFGRPLSIGYLPDQFGHIAQMPQILDGFGIGSAVLWRGVGADIDRAEFQWEALDGTPVFAVYLATSYSNGRALPEDPAELARRLQAIAADWRPYLRSSLALVMNGTDHQEPQAHLPSALAAALCRLEGMSAEIAPLASYVERARAEAANLPIHRGELRSPRRAHLLPGVTSARIRQKQRDFANLSRLERYAEPLATWADLLGGQRNLAAFADLAWKISLQNHPHDSICGCSVDQVHRDMEHRFDQVELIVQRLQKEAFAAVAERLDTRGSTETALVVFNPNPAGESIVETQLYLDSPEALTAVDAAGREIPVQTTAGPSEPLFEVELPPAEIRPHVETINSREFLGLFINDVRFERRGDRLDLTLITDRVLRGELDIDATRARWLALLDDPALRAVHAVARSAHPTRVRLAAPLNGHGLTTLWLRGNGGAATSAFATSGRSIENRWYRLAVNDDGSVAITDKELSLDLPRCNLFVDEGDRGDTYNFDPLEAAPIAVAAAAPLVTVAARGPVAAEMRIELTYRLPRRLAPDRESRTSDTVEVPIVTTIALYDRVKRIDFTTEIDNRAEDHRLRMHLRVPLRTDRVWVEQAFGAVTRPLNLEADSPVERPVGTGPQKTFAALTDGRRGVALFNRGLQEIEARRAGEDIELALTLIRAVGWLSRGDLRWRNGHAGPGLATPEAQCLGMHRFDYALTTFPGDLDAAGIVRQAHAFAYPPAATTTGAHAGSLPRNAALVECDNPLVVVSAIAPGRRPDEFTVRCYNTSATAQRARLAFPGARRVRTVDFLGRPRMVGFHSRAAVARGMLRPYQIVSFLVTAGPAAPSSRP